MTSNKSWFFIKSLYSGLVLDIERGEKGGRIVTFPQHGGDNQLWTWRKKSLMSKTGFVLDVDHSNKEKGAKTISWVYHGGLNQQWTLDGDKIISCLNGMALDIKGESMEQLVEIVLWPTKSGVWDNQSWTLVPSGSYMKQPTLYCMALFAMFYFE